LRKLFVFFLAMSFNVKTSNTAAPPRTSQYVGPYVLQKTLGKGQTGIDQSIHLFTVYPSSS
jgi:hypothetical protein